MGAPRPQLGASPADQGALRLGSIHSIARLQLVAQSVSTSKFAPLDPVRQARWAQFLIKFMQAIPVVDRQTRVRGHLQTTRRWYVGVFDKATPQSVGG